MVNYELHRPDELTRGDWRLLQTVQHDGFTHELIDSRKQSERRTQEEVDHLVNWNNPDAFYLGHIYPETEKRFNPNQLYTEKRVAIASEGNDVIGFGYTAHNTSGSSARLREAKSLSLIKNYLWFRELAVRPDHQRQRVGLHTARLLLKDAISAQPLAVYTWPELLPHLPPFLVWAGMKKTGEEKKDLLGGENGVVTQERYQARTVHAVLSRLKVLG